MVLDHLVPHRGQMLVLFVIFVALVAALGISTTSTRKKDIASCMVIKTVSEDDVEDLLEWLDYHLDLGVGVVYVVDNNSTFPLLHHISKYIDAGNVVYEYKAYTNKDEQHHYQLESYQQCIDKHRNDHNWMTFIDVDEYLVVAEKNVTLLNTLQRFDQYGGLTVNWMLFGSSGHVKRPKGGVRSSYSNCRESYMIKTIANLKYVNTIGGGGGCSPHTFNYYSGYFAIDTNGSRVDGIATHPYHWKLARLRKPEQWIWVSEPPFKVFESLYLAHYILKSKEDWKARAIRAGRAELYQRPDRFFDRMDRHLRYNCTLLSQIQNRHPQLKSQPQKPAPPLFKKESEESLHPIRSLEK